MTRAQREAVRARNKRSMLIFLLGGVCKKCGSDEQLEFHHKYGRTWEARKCSRLRRMVLYFRDYDKGLLTILCHNCNKAIGKYRCVSGYYKSRRKWVPF